MNLKKSYKQYFTPKSLAEYMVNIIPDEEINSIIDLSMGECGLLEEAKKRWSEAELFGADIDEDLIIKIREKSPYIKTHGGDSLTSSLDGWKEYNKIINENGFDLAIANPPFNYFDQKMISIKDNEKMVLPIEVRFLIKYINIVKENGYICIILPYGFLSLDLYKEFRVKILTDVTIIKVIKIFDNCFDRIDADTCLILMQKCQKTTMNIQDKISIEYLDSKFVLNNKTTAHIENFNRWDLEYQQLLEKTKYITDSITFRRDIISNYVEDCRRGKSITMNRGLLSEKGVRFIHTTDVKTLYISNTTKKFVKNSKGYFGNSILQENNILIGRVGQGCIGKIAIVSKRYPKMFFSDCLFALKTTDINPYYLTLFLASTYGQMQLKGFSKGSCSKYITKEELLKINIMVPNKDIQNYYGEQYQCLLRKPGRINKDKLFSGLILELEDEIRRSD